VVIVEGPDGAGKTTLIRELAHSLSLPIAPRVVSQGAEAMVDLKHWVETNLAMGFQETLFDRHRLISEPIYGTLLRWDEQEPGFNDLTWLTGAQFQLRKIQPTIIACLPSLDTCLDNYVQEENNARLFDEKTYKQLYWMYFHWVSNNPGVFVYDYRYDNDRMVKDYIRATLRGRKDG
jgi:GTPase SAR1 family protein